MGILSSLVMPHTTQLHGHNYTLTHTQQSQVAHTGTTRLATHHKMSINSSEQWQTSITSTMLPPKCGLTNLAVSKQFTLMNMSL